MNPPLNDRDSEHPEAQVPSSAQRRAVCWRRVALTGVLVLLAACDSPPTADPQLSAESQLNAGPKINLPDASMLSPDPGCKVVSAEPARLLPGTSDGNGGQLFGRRAVMRFVADCLPPVSDPASWWQPYRITYEQNFSLPREPPGASGAWRASDATPVIDWDLPKRPLDSVSEGQGKNCAVLMDRIESETLPCMMAKAPAFGAILQEAMQSYRAQSQYTLSVHDENHLNTLRLGRDAQCLGHWRDTQRKLLVPDKACAVD